jgi:hypothetical protein
MPERDGALPAMFSASKRAFFSQWNFTTQPFLFIQKILVTVVGAVNCG